MDTKRRLPGKTVYFPTMNLPNKKTIQYYYITIAFYFL